MSSTTTIFITGVTGYIGGDILFALNEAHPEYQYTAIVRDSSKGAVVAAQYPKIRLVYGTNDDTQLLEEESSKADIVIHTADASDHVGAAQAFATGLHTGHNKSHPGFWLHTSGTGILTWQDTRDQKSGETLSYRPYDDLENVSALTSLPDEAFHRAIDKIVLGASSDVVKTAIICPPTIYGVGRGPGNTKSRQAYDLVKLTLENGQAPVLGKGLAQWDNVHIHDLANLYILLVEAAVSYGRDPALDGKLWGAEEGYFLAEGGHHVWGEVAEWIAEDAFKKGYIKEKSTVSMSTDQAKDIGGFGALSWGLNSRGDSKRARKYLGWETKGRSLREEIPYIVDSEATELGLKKGYAEKVAGTA